MEETSGVFFFFGGGLSIVKLSAEQTQNSYTPEVIHVGSPGGTSGKEPACQCRRL